MKYIFLIMFSFCMLSMSSYVLSSEPNIIIEGKIISKYGNRYHPILKKYRVHHGIDLHIPNKEIHSPVSGTVISSGWERGYGNTIRITINDSEEIMFAHLSKLYIKKGESVDINDNIGTVGRTGLTTGIHLHVEYRVNGKRINPTEKIKINFPSNN